MAKLCAMLVIMSCTLAIAIAVPAVHGGAIDRSPHGVKEWFKKLPDTKEKVTELHFYFHDVITSKTPTAKLIARANTTSTGADFGALFMADDPLTVGPEPGSEEIGRAQGMYGQAALEGIKFHMDLNLVFTKGKYKDSTLALVGWNPVFVKSYREMSVVGGSGYFRLARGVATAKTYQFDPVSANAVVEYNVVVLHY